MKKQNFTACALRRSLSLALSLCALLLLGCVPAKHVSTPTPTQAPFDPTTPPQPEPTDAKAPDKAEQLLAQMTLEQKIGQLFFVRCPEDGVAELARYPFGGYLLFAVDFDGKSAEQIRETIASYQAASEIPLLIGADEEGGKVVRISSNPALRSSPFGGLRALFERGGSELVCSTEQEKIDLLRSLGVNVNFAPVCDLSADSGDYIHSRTLTGDAAVAAECISQMVGLYCEGNTGCVLKHFPGYGSNTDTHKDFSVDRRTLDSLRANDFLPFKAGMNAGAGCVMLSHNIVTCVDAERPASLSPAWHTLLREELGYDGCLITDGLSMNAIRQFCDSGSAAVQAVMAGNDLLCCSDYDVQFPAVLAAVQRGDISVEQIDGSVLRILRWKEQLGLLG